MKELRSFAMENRPVFPLAELLGADDFVTRALCGWGMAQIRSFAEIGPCLEVLVIGCYSVRSICTSDL